MATRWQIEKNFLDGMSFEISDLVTSGLGEHWVKSGSPTLSLNTNSSYVKHRTKSQKIVGVSASDGIYQIADISDAINTSFRLVYYIKVDSGTLNVKVEALDSNDVVQATPLNVTHTANGSLTKTTQSISTIVSGTTITQLKVYFIQSGATAMTCYIDAVMLYESTDATLEINPTNLGMARQEISYYEDIMDGTKVKIQHTDEGRRYQFDDFKPVFVYVTQNQKEILEKLVNKRVIIITHLGEIFDMDFIRMEYTYIEREDELDAHFGITLSFQEAMR